MQFLYASVPLSQPHIPPNTLSCTFTLHQSSQMYITVTVSTVKSVQICTTSRSQSAL